MCTNNELAEAKLAKIETLARQLIRMQERNRHTSRFLIAENCLAPLIVATAVLNMVMPCRWLWIAYWGLIGLIAITFGVHGVALHRTHRFDERTHPH